MSNYFLEVSGIGKVYEEQENPALSSINLSVEKGEVISLLGRSGSGKSSLLRILAGLLNPSEGSAILDGHRIKPPSEQLVAGHEHIRLVAQGFQLAPKMRVWENLRYFLLKWPRPRQEERIQELLQLCGLSEMRDKFPRELSGGQQQRLALGRALADYPTLLLLDEPFSHLDPALRYELREVLDRLIKQSSTTAIMATHDPEDAMYLSDRIAVLEEGYCRQLDTPQRLYNQPVSPYIANFFGQPNFLDPSDFQPLPTHLQDSANICIREEDIKIKKHKGLECTILDIRFLGRYYQVTVQTPQQVTLRLKTDKAGLSKGKSCFIKIKWENALYWRSS